MNSHSLQLKKALDLHPGATRCQLREATHLDARTIAGGLNYLLRCGLIRESTVKQAGAGRPVKQYFPASEQNFHVGAIYLDLPCLLCMIQRSDGTVVAYEKEEFILSQSTVSHAVRRCQRILNDLENRYRLNLSAVGITMRNQKSPRFLPLAVRLLKRLLKIPVFGNYPIDVFAWKYHIQHPEIRSFATVHFRYEIELSVFDRDHIDETGPVFSRELDHLCGDSRGPLCWCGRKGCLENYINEYLMNESFRDLTNLKHSSPDALHDAFLAGDPGAQKIIRKGEDCVIKALRGILAKYHPEVIHHILFEDDRLVRLMDKVTDGSWMPRRAKVRYCLDRDEEPPGYKCVLATAESTFFRWQQLLNEDGLDQSKKENQEK